MAKLFSLNLGAIDVSQEDQDSIGRGEEVGYEYGTVTDLDTGVRYRVFSASCGLDHCNCAVTFERILEGVEV